MTVQHQRSRVDFMEITKFGPSQLGIKARVNIPAESRLYELCGFLSVDVPLDSTNPSMCASPREGYYNLLIGPARLVNHSCDPNAEVRLTRCPGSF